MFKFICLAIFSFVLASCATVGKPFKYQGPDTIVKGKTTEADVIKAYGDPFRVGYENDFPKWTYGYYKYRLFGDSETKDLDITFDKTGVVSSYTYSSSSPDEVTQAVGPR
jgi:hypothetical protein